MKLDSWTNDQIKIGIIGSRRRNSSADKLTLFNFLKDFLKQYEGKQIIFVSGGCPKGGDRFAEEIAKELDIFHDMIIYYPNKADLPENPDRSDFRKINYARNILIAHDCDELIGMVAKDRLGGTEHTILHFEKFTKKKVILI